ncbi:MAG: 50S ribosome-binding GTPase [Succinivibrionaceae bacterium]|nr:50S ribosome-binding GTPase [Succinivibrionaceae bacterium]
MSESSPNAAAALRRILGRLSFDLNREDPGLEEAIGRLAELASPPKDQGLAVACIGLYNHGKSSLLNNLVGDADNRTFKVSDSRQTVRNQEFTHDGIRFIDTPGLNASGDDDSAALSALEQSDVYLFVHKASVGGLDGIERAVLERIASSWPQGKFLSRTIFVLTNLDKCRGQGQIEEVCGNVGSQLRGIFGAGDADIIPVSTTTYMKGLKEGKRLLCEHSAVPALWALLQGKVQGLAGSREADRQARVSAMAESILPRLLQVRERAQQELSEVQGRLGRRQQAFHSLKQRYKKLRRRLDALS